MEYYCHQTFNDKWLIESFFRGMRNGFFIDAGGADGQSESATLLLEKEFGWKGVIVEPCKEFYEKLIKIRSSKCIHAALSEKDGISTFITAKSDMFLSGLADNISEWHKDNVYKEGYISEEVQTISPKTLLMNNCPPIIDLIAFDMEGSELKVLKAFPFDQYFVKLFIIEISNFMVRDLMFNNGFLEIRNQFNTECPWENYFINRKIIDTEFHQ